MRGFAPVDADNFPVVVKAKKIHEKPIVGIRMFRDAISGKNIVLSAANDSVKLLTAVLFGDEAELTETGQYIKHRCGIQSFDMHNNGTNILLVDAMNVLHVIERDRLGEMSGSTIDKGLMGILYAKFIPETDMIFSTSFGQGLQKFNIGGDSVNNYTYEKVQHVSVVSYSPDRKYLAIGTDNGTVDIFSGLTFEFQYSIEDVHFKKIRVLEFSSDEEYLLVGCDDKSLSSHILRENSSSLLQKYYYHTGYILSASFDYGTNSSQFASSSSDQKVVLWNTMTGEPIHVFQNCYKEEAVTAVRFSHNGHYLLSGTANGQLLMHRISGEFEEDQLMEEEVNGVEESGLEINEDDAHAEVMPDLSESDDDDTTNVNGANEENGYHDNGYSPQNLDDSQNVSESQAYAPSSPTEGGFYNDDVPASPDPDEYPRNGTGEYMPDMAPTATDETPKSPVDYPKSPSPENEGQQSGYTPKTPESPDNHPQQNFPQTPSTPQSNTPEASAEGIPKTPDDDEPMDHE